VTPSSSPRFDFRDLAPGVEVGTASDRYAGWLGQIYTPGKYEGKISARKRRLGGKTFKEKVLPVESLREYFRHFPVLEIDYTFYRLLLDPSGNPTDTFRVLQSYARHLEPGDRIVVKVPQIVTARRFFRGGAFVPNADYLDPEIFTKQFYEPALSLLGDSLVGLIFEQEYQKAKERQEPEVLAEELGSFFGAIPRDHRYHLELRTEKYLSPSLFQVLEESGVGQVLSHWTWLPSLREQYRRSGGRFFNSGRHRLIRLLTPRHVRYEEAYAAAFPFDKLQEELISPGMIEDTVSIIGETAEREGRVTVIVNNRAAGNAPLLAQMIADRFMTPPDGTGPPPP
jgi:uncharacterized protein YecE (DUF72 family)